jgi:hypothetical protein
MQAFGTKQTSCRQAGMAVTCHMKAVITADSTTMQPGTTNMSANQQALSRHIRGSIRRLFQEVLFSERFNQSAL